jgi:hypothetical protein
MRRRGWARSMKSIGGRHRKCVPMPGHRHDHHGGGTRSILESIQSRWGFMSEGPTEPLGLPEFTTLVAP